MTTTREHVQAVAKLIGQRSAMVLNLRKLSEGRELSYTNGIMLTAWDRFFLNRPELITPTIQLLGKLRFDANKMTPDQATRLTQLMRDHFRFAWCYRRFVAARLQGAAPRETPDNDLYTVLFESSSKAGLEALTLE